jgi:hypothetical protein
VCRRRGLSLKERRELRNDRSSLCRDKMGQVRLGISIPIPGCEKEPTFCLSQIAK